MQFVISPRSSAFAFLLVATAIVWGALEIPLERDTTDQRATHIEYANIAFGYPVDKYIEIIGGCGAAYEGGCVTARAGAGEEFRIVHRLRKGVLLRVASTIPTPNGAWYRISYDEPIRYPERVARGQFVAADDRVRTFFDQGILEDHTTASSSKRILVDRSEQKLYAYEGEALFMQTTISTGLDMTPTPRGTFSVFKKTPTRYMQGPQPGISTQYYDLPGVPWNLYFTHQGAVIHGAYWHNSFGKKWSNGCVNVPLDRAEALYRWTDIGTSVIVRD